VRARGWRSNLALLAFSLVLGGALAELGARLWLERLADDEAFKAYASVAQLEERLAQPAQSLSRYAPHRYIGFIPSPGYRSGANYHDPLGYRGGPIALHKPEGEFRIVCVGASTTYADPVEDPAESYPAQLEAELRRRGYGQVRTVNAGASGYTSYETLVNFAFRVLELDPDMVLVYHGINDLAARMVWPPSAYRGDNSGAVQLASGLARDTPLLERSTFARILRVRLGYARSHLDLFRNFSRTAKTNHYPIYMGQRSRGIYPSGLFEEVDVMQMLAANPPVYFRRNLASLALLARGRGVQPVFMTFAHSQKVADPVLNTPEVVQGLAEQNRMILGLGAELGVPVFDLARAMPPNPRLYFGAVHFTAAGNRRRAQLIADFLVEQGLLPAPAARGQDAGGPRPFR
jgi:lysophospholipase L1-like esterase